MNIHSLSPNSVWNYFDEITRIPRPSGKEEKIIAYLLDFAKKHNLSALKDDSGNVVIIKEATKGYEHLPTVILQSHTDMVAEKEASSSHNFETDPINAYVDGDWVKARGTTLGADDGIGMAAQLAVLASDNVEHGKIEALFTCDEERGLTGAREMSANLLTGKYLINLDSEEEGEIYIGCAGGERTVATFNYRTEAPGEKAFFFEIIVSGLNGGHSGSDIHRGFGNALKIIARILHRLQKSCSLSLASIEGGNLLNAIPRDARAVCAVPSPEKEKVRIELNLFLSDIEAELALTDPNIQIALASCEKRELIDSQTALQLIKALHALPNGVIGMSATMPQLVETSTNLASIRMKAGNVIEIGTSQRSSVLSMKEYIVASVAHVFELAGAEVQHGDSYPGWTPNPNSKLLAAAKERYKKLYNRELKVNAIHAGLECGLILEKYPHLEMISCGPTLTDVHSPYEKLHIPSVKLWWNFLVEMLKNIPRE